MFVANSNILASVSPRASANVVPPGDSAPEQENLQTAKLKVDGMWCPSCSYIVGRALMLAPGVVDAKVSVFAKIATVTYDKTKTTAADLVAATTNYGYPSEVMVR